MQRFNFPKEYESKTDEELLHLALVSDQLTEDANQALSAVLRSRGIDTEERKREFQQDEAKAERRRARNVGQLGFLHFCGIGRQRYGKSNYLFNPVSRMEKFTTTIFVVLFWLPVIPTGTYRVQRKKRFFFSDMIVLEKLPLDWTQVLGVWAVTAVSLLGLTLTVKFLPSLLSQIGNR